MCAVYPQNTGTRLRILQDEHEVSVDKTVKLSDGRHDMVGNGFKSIAYNNYWS